MNGMPIGIDDFRKLRDEDLCYVDKSMFIDEILESSAKVTQITRPRRFGKTLNLSMTDAYLNIDYADERDRFSDLEITNIRPDDPEKNSNFVINLNFKDLKIGSYEKFEASLRNRVFSLYCKFGELKDSERLTPDLRKWYRDLTEMTADYDTLSNSILYLCKMIEAHHGKKPIILIDEYDSPLNGTYGDEELHKNVKRLVKDFLGAALKSNGSLRFAVITGVMRISKESIFSDLNNLEVNDVFSTDYDEMFGFTQDEVEWLLRENGREDKIDEAGEWYDGYRFGDEDVYNPWSIISYIKKDCKPAPYWAGTSGNSIIEDILAKANETTYDSLMELAKDNEQQCVIDPAVTYKDISIGGESTFTVLVMAGYLNAIPCGNMYRVSIPNQEMKYVFSSKIMKYLAPTFGETLCELFIQAMRSGDADGMTSNLNKILEESFSLRMPAHENVYQAFLIGLFLRCPQYKVESEKESGDGYFDIRLLAKDPQVDSIIIEVKRAAPGVKDATMKRYAAKALNQIVEKRYAESIDGRVLSYGMVFSGKRALVRYRELER